jgi:WD40 repeat protein
VSDHPYPGLRPFRPDETDIFFGREEQSDQLLERLARAHFLAVVGPSGCGKSSLVKTGLIPGLEAGLLTQLGARWRIADLRPGDHPLDRLAAALLEDDRVGSAYATPGGADDRRTAQAFLRAALARGPRSLHEVIARVGLPGNEQLLVLVDQFEELFRFAAADAGEEASAFVALLLESARHPQVYVVITMRSDYLGDCARFYGLPEAVNEGLFLAPRLMREQLRDAVALPARVFGGEIDEALVNRIVNDAGDNPDQLPLVQHCLMWMWHHATAASGSEGAVPLTVAGYQAIGGLEESLSRHADKAFGELSESHRRVAEVMFRALTEQTAGRQDTRRPACVRDVAGLAEVPWQDVAAVVEVFRRPGRSFLTPAYPIALSEATLLDISHESLIRLWRRLADWAMREAEAGRIYRRLDEDAQEWRRGEGSLLVGGKLRTATNWRAGVRPTARWAQRYGGDFNLVERFIDESADSDAAARLRERRQRALKRSLGLGLIGALSFAALSLGWAWYQTEQSKAQIQDAYEQLADTTKNLVSEKQARARESFRSVLGMSSVLARAGEYGGALDLAEAAGKDADAVGEATVTKAQRAVLDNLRAYLHLLVSRPEATLQLPGRVYALAADDGLRYLAAGSDRGRVWIVDLQQGFTAAAARAVETGGEDPVWTVAFDPAGRRFLTGGSDEHVYVIDLPAERAVRGFTLPRSERARAIAVSSDGRLIAAGGTRNRITVWEAGGRQLTAEPVRAHEEYIGEGGLAFGPGGRRLVSGSHDSTVKLWSLDGGTLRGRLLGRHLSRVAGVAISVDGGSVASGSRDGAIEIWKVDAAGDVQPATLSGHEGLAGVLRFVGPDGRYLLSASADQTVRLWDVDGRMAVKLFAGHGARVMGLAVGTDSLVSADFNGVLHRWTLPVPPYPRIALPKSGTAVAIDREGRHVLTGLDNGMIEVHPLGARNRSDPVLQVQGHAKTVHRVVMAPAGDRVATAGDDGVLVLWRYDAAAGVLSDPRRFPGHHGGRAVHAAAFSVDGRCLASVGFDGTLRLLDLTAGDTSEPASQIYAPATAESDVRLYSVDFDAAGRIVTTGADGRVLVWPDGGTGCLGPREPRELATRPEAQKWARFSPDGTHVATVGAGQSVAILSAEDGKMTAERLGAHDGVVWRAEFSPDGAQLATAGGDGVLRFWDLSAGAEVRESFALKVPWVQSPTLTNPLVDFDYRCTPLEGCWAAVPVKTRELLLFHLGDPFRRAGARPQ